MSLINYSIDGNQVCAVKHNFQNLQISPAGFGDSLEDAFLALMKELSKRNELPELRSLQTWEAPWLEALRLQQE